MKFLLVEDDPNHSALMTARLEEIGGEVTLAQTVSHAIRALGRSREYDLVVLDQDLPDGKGFEVQACLKGFSDAPSVLFVTSDDSADAAVAAMREGAAGYVVKRSNYLAEFEKEVSRAVHAPGPVAAANRTEFEERERVTLRAVLERNQWNVSAAARELGMGRGKLRGRMSALGIDS